MKQSRNEIQREERKQQIVDVALELFSQKGYHGVSVNMLAKACGISKGLMYNYFQSKEDLLNFILEDYAQNISKELDLDGDGVLTKDEFAHFIRSVYKMTKENPKYYKLIFGLSFQEDVSSQLHKISSDIMPLNYQLLYDYFKSLGREAVDEDIIMFSSVIKGFLLQVVLTADMPAVLEQYTSKFDKMVERIIEEFTK